MCVEFFPIPKILMTSSERLFAEAMERLQEIDVQEIIPQGVMQIPSVPLKDKDPNQRPSEKTWKRRGFYKNVARESV